LATTYAETETLEYPWGLYDRSIVLPPGKATSPDKVVSPFTVGVIIPVAHPSASTNFRELSEAEVKLPRRGTMTQAIGHEETKDRGFLEEAPARPGGLIPGECRLAGPTLSTVGMMTPAEVWRIFKGEPC
jgi:hypothetical protein